MKQMIEIEVPDGKRAVWKNNKVVFEDIKPQLPKTWEEFCKQNMIKNEEYFLGTYSDFIKRGYGQRYKNTDRNVLPNKQAAEAHLALVQLHQLRDCYRQGWKPNWTDEKRKFYISFWDNKTLSVLSTILIPHFLTFQTIELANEFLNNFRDLIKQAGDLI